ncbi:MAG: hypothetical protein SYNGOMJ08_00378 [Candidatus Syntrophoarchaeum sp. GoM_oil]|nr:MAG: hypothetical protein SYNGOMJ08_00378 [Candidatus Syntrophoarchaeum sp. GoM_oil]
MAQTALAGDFKIVHTDSSDNVIAELGESPSDIWSAETSDAQKMEKIDINKSTIFMEGDQLQVFLKVRTTVTEHTTSTASTDTLRIPMTMKNMRTNVKFPKYLTISDMTDERGFTDNQVWTATERYLLYSYTFGSQMSGKFGIVPTDQRVSSAICIKKQVTTS